MKKQSERGVAERRDRLIEAASTAFFRYGFARATVADIAEEANVHRPALYALFPDGKDELFEAALSRLVDSEVAQYRLRVKTLKTLREKLLYCVCRWSLGGFRLTETHPDARDAFDMAYPAVRKMYATLTSFYAELLHDAVAASSLRVSAIELSRLLVFSSRGIRDIATDAKSLETLLTDQVDVFLAALAHRDAAAAKAPRTPRA